MLNTRTLPDIYRLWPQPPELNFATLYTAERNAIEAMRSWHLKDGRDVTFFQDVSLGRLWRYRIIEPTMTLFRQCARGVAFDSSELWRSGMEGKYSPTPYATNQMRREDARARAFRALKKTASLIPRTRTRHALVMCSPSNRPLWRLWLKQRPRSLTLDFPLQQPPGLEIALRALACGTRVFDPRPCELSQSQHEQVSRIRDALTELPKDASWRRLFNVDGRNVYEPFMDTLIRPLIAELSDLARKCNAFETELSCMRPDLILLPQEVSTDAQLFVQLGRRQGIPVWFLNHGFPGGGYHFDEAPHCGELECDKILAWSEADKMNYRALGVPEERLAACGNPAFDALLPLRPAHPFHGTAHKHVLVVAHSSTAGIRTLYCDEDEELFFREVMGVLERLGAAYATYKLHPGRPNRPFYKQLQDDLKPKMPVDILQNEPFADLVDRCDFVIGPTSTAIFETLLAGKDYFLFNRAPSYCPPPFEVSNAFVAKTARELEHNLREGYCVPREKILREFCGFDGNEAPNQASARILDLMQQELGA